MYNKPTDCHQCRVFGDLESMLEERHPLYVLAGLIHWGTFEKEFKGLYCQNNGSMAKPIRRMVGLILLKHIRGRVRRVGGRAVCGECILPEFLRGADVHQRATMRILGVGSFPQAHWRVRNRTHLEGEHSCQHRA